MLVLCGCKNQGTPVNVEYDNDDDYNVTFVFEVDGIKVYRFRDGLRTIYFTDNKGRVEYSETHTRGKTTTTEYIETLCNCNDTTKGLSAIRSR